MKKTIISVSLIIVLAFSILSASALDYSDITGHWAEKEIIESSFADLLGVKDAFLPDKAITRIEFARMLHKALGIEIYYFRAPDIKEFFGDVDNDDAGASALYDLVICNIIEASDAFRPNEPLRRDDMIHFIINALKYMTGGEYALIKMMPAPFEDDAKINPAYKNDVVEAVLLKIINGRGGNMLYPDVPAKRAEAVVATGRLLSVLKSLANVDVTAEAVLSDERIEMKLTIRNNTSKAISIQHTSGQKFDFKLFDSEGDNLYTWSADKVFITALTETVIEPGQAVEFIEALEGDAYTAIKDRIYSMVAYITGTSESFNVNPDGYLHIVSNSSAD